MLQLIVTDMEYRLERSSNNKIASNTTNMIKMKKAADRHGPA